MSDKQARLAAVEPHRSVIVQAPAGSGKTTLLVERYLALLAIADAPEEILAITFTRKAAAEMKQRVLRYLDPAFHSDAEHEQAALQKARAAQARVAEWGLRENPHRLLIRTIDSFNHYLARTMPVATALGPVPAPADNTRALYRQAARNVLALADGRDGLADDLTLLLDWRDHRSQDIEDLLASLLARREQWQRGLRVTGDLRRERLEEVLETLVCTQLQSTADALDRALGMSQFRHDDVLALLCFAAHNLTEKGKPSPVCCYIDADSLPDGTSESLPRWAGLAEALLTNKGEPRKKITVDNGFPAKTPEKVRFMALLNSMAENEPLITALHKARSLPEPRYTDGEWAVLDALVRVLQRAAGELQMVFARRGQSDFSGLAAAALRGLGDEHHGYTDLSLYLDHRFRHILVDEYQDTNWGQLHLLEKLTAGWEPASGRSLFLVGDPMQSIYRFREADVGLFIRSRDRGVGPLTLEPHRLTQNFRSREEVVEWVNDKLGPIFPSKENISAGAVAYARSEAERGPGGKVELLAHAHDADEAERLADLIATAIADHADDPEFKAAIIVRARTHLKDILPALRRRDVAYRAVKLDPLTSRPVVQDLLALTRAILYPVDTTAILAVLRSPVCGLTLADLHALAGDGHSLYDGNPLDRLHGESRSRAERVLATLDDARAHWRRRPLRDLVEGAWHRLGGPACFDDTAKAIADASAYLEALDQAAANGLLEDWNDFAELLDGQHTEGDPPSDDIKLEILTMHGAKGLEWDLVVLPGLNRRPGGNDSALLHWLPFTTEDGGEEVLLAPLRAAEEKDDPPLITLIKGEQKARGAYENQRLLYVAATRAREHLVLSACLQANSKDEIKPASGSLLADLWPTTAGDFLAALDHPASTESEPPTDAAVETSPQALRRVAAGWKPPLGAPFVWQPALPPRDRQIDIEFNWAGIQARRTGIVLHRLLERAGIIGSENLDAEQRRRLIGRIPALLKAMGTRDGELHPIAEIIGEAFERTLDSETGRWLLSHRHRDGACELPISGVLDGRLINAIVDRTFIDADGIRWIIDYKSGYRAGSDLEAFFAQERERYRDQLGNYRRLFEQMGETAITTALYLPRHGRLEVVEGC
jgi:ATP-dependent helicase/nuclease subunit A